MTKETVEKLMRVHGDEHSLEGPDRELTTCNVCVGLLALWLHVTDSEGRPREAASTP